MSLNLRKYLSELLGTFGLTFAVLGSLTFNWPLATPLVAGLTLMLFVYSLGSISGTHINPAVTIALWAIQKIEVKDAIFYIVFQYLGAMIAIYVFRAIGFTVPLLEVADTAAVFLGEALGTMFFVMGIAAVVYGRVKDNIGGLMIGGSLLFGVFIASMLSNGVLNPAVALGIGSFSVMYVVGPIIGGIAGALIYGYLADELKS